jgi:hypothetical protein
MQIYKQLEFITRLYALDSKKYSAQSRYWSTYAYRVALALSPEKVRAATTIPNIFGHISFLDDVAPNIEEQEELEKMDSEIKRNAQIKSILNILSEN